MNSNPQKPVVNFLTKEMSLPPFIESFLASVVGSIFGAAAIAIFWILWGMFSSHYAARSWVAVPVTVEDAQFINNRSGGMSPSRSSIVSKLKVSYRYEYKGVGYTGTQVDFSFGSDNIGDSRRRRQMRMLGSEEPVVFVNPANPAQSVLDRSLPVEQVNFAVIFLFFPCGLGTIMIMGWSGALLSKLGLEWPNRFMLPLYGIVHTLPAFYAPAFASADIGLFGWLIVIISSAVFMVSLRGFWRRLKDPTIDSPQMVTRYQRGLMKLDPLAGVLKRDDAR